MVTSRRMVSHTASVISGTVSYSSLEMWFLAPVKSFAIMEKTFYCSGKKFSFVTDGSKFGILDIKFGNEEFVKTYLKVVSAKARIGGMTSTTMTLEAFNESPALINAVFTKDFAFSGGEQVHHAAGAKLPPRLLNNVLACKEPMTYTLTFTDKSILIEAYNRSFRIFSSISWKSVYGIYWSNFQANSENLTCFNNPKKMFPLYGYAGSQIRFNLKGTRITVIIASCWI